MGDTRRDGFSMDVFPSLSRLRILEIFPRASPGDRDDL